MKNLAQITENQDIITKEYLVAGYEPLLPATPLDPGTKYLNGLRQWSTIAIGSGGYAANVYLTNNNSTLNPAYKALSYVNDTTETESTITRNSIGETQGVTFLFDSPIGVSTVDAGTWKFAWTGKVNTTAGGTRLRIEVFKRTSGGVETVLFSVTSDVLSDTVYTYRTIETNQPIFIVNTTDTLGVKTYMNTTIAATVTGYILIGGTRSAFINSPLALRHNQLRGLNDDTNNVHVLSTERTNLTAITALSTNGFIKRTGAGTYAIDLSTYALSTHNHNGTYQPADGDLTAIAALAGINGFLKKTGTDTWTLDTSTYSLSTHNHNGTYQPSDADLTAIAALSGTNGFLKKTATDTWTLDTSVYSINTHTHLLSAITDVTATITELNYIDGVTSNIQTQLNAKAPLASPTFTGIVTAPTFSGALGEAYLTWGGKNFSGSYGCIDAAMIGNLGANRFAFLKALGLTIEYSRDSGATWLDYGATDLQKIAIFSGLTSTSFAIGKADAINKATAEYQLRITIDTSDGQLYTTLNKFCIYCSTNGSTGTACTIDAALESTPTTFVTMASNIPISGWSGYNIINTPGFTTYGNTTTTQYGKVRFTFTATGGSDTYTGLTISSIYGFGGVGWTVASNMARNGHLYSWDASENVVFPANITGKQIISTLTNGTSPLSISSTTLVTNLNADLLDGNHASAFSLTTHNHNGTYQAADADLTAIAALAGTSGFLKKTAADTWSLDTSTYSLSTHNHNGTYQASDADLTAIAALTGTTGLLRKTAANTWSLDTTALGDMTIAVYGGSTSGVVAKSDSLKETRAGGTEKVWVGTKAQYDAIVTKDAGTSYITTDETYGSYISLDGTGHILASYMPLTVSDHIASTSNPHGVTKTQIGLQYVNNTSDLDKPISTTTQNALDLKAASNHTHSTYAPINNPTFTGTISGITATMVGLGNVTNENKSTMLTDMTITGTTRIEEIIEQANLVVTAYTADANIDLKTGAVFYNTANATANPTFNFRGDGTNTLASMLAVGKSITFTILITNNSTAYYPTAYTVDGTSVTPKWSGSAPTSGNVSAIDIYTFTIIKTAAIPTYTVLASRTKFA